MQTNMMNAAGQPPQLANGGDMMMMNSGGNVMPPQGAANFGPPLPTMGLGPGGYAPPPPPHNGPSMTNQKLPQTFSSQGAPNYGQPQQQQQQQFAPPMGGGQQQPAPQNMMMTQPPSAFQRPSPLPPTMGQPFGQPQQQQQQPPLVNPSALQPPPSQPISNSALMRPPPMPSQPPIQNFQTNGSVGQMPIHHQPPPTFMAQTGQQQQLTQQMSNLNLNNNQPTQVGQQLPNPMMMMNRPPGPPGPPGPQVPGGGMMQQQQQLAPQQGYMGQPQGFTRPPGPPGAGMMPPPTMQAGPPSYGTGPMGQPQQYSQPYDQQQQQFAQQQQQQQQKMDLDQIPNPIEVMLNNSTKYGGEYFETNEAGKMPPLVTTNFISKDMGNCPPHYIRSSIYSVPANPDLLKQSKLPFCLALTPFAEIRAEEREPVVSDLGELGPVRCKRCKAYMCPFMQFIDNGKKFQCPFCDDVTPVPQPYFNHLDHMGRRIDLYERPELSLGSYEFVATKDYCRQQTLPQPPAFIFMIDVSINSIRSGLLHVLCPFIKNQILPNLPKDDLNTAEQAELRVGFVTYDKELHFYNLKNSLAAPQMMIVSDYEEVFVPILDGFLVKLSESKQVIDQLLDSLPGMFHESKETELVLGPVVEAGLEALKSAQLCGKLFVFHSNLPNSLLAPGCLKNRDDRKLLGSDKEKQILTPQTDYYAQLGKRCVENGCSLDLFLIPNQYCDVATLCDLTRKTAGQIYKYDFFMADTHGQRLCEDLAYAVQSSVAFDGVMKVRTSTGVRAVDYLGNFSMYGNDVELAGVSRQTSLSVELKHDDKLNENSKVFIQAALLYTSLSGQRRIRLHNLSLSVCTQFAPMFSSCELDTLVNYMAKLACRSVTVSTPKSIRDNLIQQISNILATYRKNCTNSPAKGQFILPETLKLLPVFSNSLLKSDAIFGGQNVTTDERAWLMYRLMSMDINSTYALFYPRLIPVHDLTSSTTIPTPIRCIYERLKDDGIYLLENGLVMYLWIGTNADPTIVQNLFGVSAIQQLNVEKCKLLEIDTPISINLRSVINLINDQRKTHLKFIVIRQRDNLEIFFKNYLVEDKGLNQNSLSYVEYLYHLHREIKNILN